MEDCGSVRMAVPIDMKKLGFAPDSSVITMWRHNTTQKEKKKKKRAEPESGSRAEHILAETTYEPVGARTILYQSVSTYCLLRLSDFPVQGLVGGATAYRKAGQCRGRHLGR